MYLFIFCLTLILITFVILIYIINQKKVKREYPIINNENYNHDNLIVNNKIKKSNEKQNDNKNNNKNNINLKVLDKSYINLKKRRIHFSKSIIINLVPPSSFTKDEEYKIKNIGNVSIPIYVKKITNLNLYSKSKVYKSYVNKDFFEKHILSYISNIYKNFNLEFNLINKPDENGRNNIGVLLYNNINHKTDNYNINGHFNNILYFFMKNYYYLNNPKYLGLRQIARFLLLSYIDERLIEKDGINIYYVPFLWHNTDVITIDRFENNKPLNAVIFVAEYKINLRYNRIEPTLIGKKNINLIKYNISLNIGFILNIHRTEFNNVNKLLERKIQYIRYNAHNIYNTNFLNDLRFRFKDRSILPSHRNYNNYEYYKLINNKYKNKYFCNHKKNCIENLKLIQNNIENYMKTKNMIANNSEKKCYSKNEEYINQLKFSFI